MLRAAICSAVLLVLTMVAPAEAQVQPKWNALLRTHGFGFSPGYHAFSGCPNCPPAEVVHYGRHQRHLFLQHGVDPSAGLPNRYHGSHRENWWPAPGTMYPPDYSQPYAEVWGRSQAGMPTPAVPVEQIPGGGEPMFNGAELLDPPNVDAAPGGMEL